jgi:hypothetical protein
VRASTRIGFSRAQTTSERKRHRGARRPIRAEQTGGREMAHGCEDNGSVCGCLAGTRGGARHASLPFRTSCSALRGPEEGAPVSLPPLSLRPAMTRCTNVKDQPRELFQRGAGEQSPEHGPTRAGPTAKRRFSGEEVVCWRVSRAARSPRGRVAGSDRGKALVLRLQGVAGGWGFFASQASHAFEYSSVMPNFCAVSWHFLNAARVVASCGAEASSSAV